MKIAIAAGPSTKPLSTRAGALFYGTATSSRMSLPLAVP